MPSIHFGGSRALAPAPIVGQVVRAVQAQGMAVHVGCAQGADSQVVAAAAASSLVVFASFGASGAGSWSGSAVGAVSAAAARGASVRWLAGGPLAIPLVGRLMRRSQAALSGCAASVFFLAGPSSRGSLAVAGFAVQAGQPVFAFCASQPCAPRGCLGSWAPASFVGFSCWQWQPAAVQQRLF